MLKHDVDTTTFEDLEKTAAEFGRVALHLSKYSMVIVMDNLLTGKDYIKQFDNTPYGMALARRWLVRMNEADEKSDQPFEELRAEYLEYLRQEREGACAAGPEPEQQDHRPTIAQQDTTHIIW